MIAAAAQPAADFLYSVDELSRRAATRPLDYMRWLPAQEALLRSTEKQVLLRCGNQSQGKTTAGLAECIYRALGSHPFKPVPKGKRTIWIICAGWSQSIEIQQKLWDLAPKDLVDPATVFDDVKGFKGKHPTLRFRNGSKIRIKTTKQGGLQLSSATIDFALFDEPPEKSRTYGEILKRVQKRGGAVWMTMTPVNADVEWLQAECESGKIKDLPFRLEPQTRVFVGTDELIRLDDEERTPCDEAWIELVESEGLAWEVPVVVHGEWEFRAVHRVFEAFRQDKHVIQNLLRSEARPRGQVELCFGIDFGEDKLRTVGVYVYVDRSGEFPKIYVVGEYAPLQATTTEMDAAGVLGMLGRLGDQWTDLDEAWGDKRFTDARGTTTKKACHHLLAAIAKKRKTSQELRPRIKVAKRGVAAGRGSVHRGVRWLHECMIREDHFYVDASCVWLIESLNKWDGTTNSKHKDAIDALRYALRHLIIPSSVSSPRTWARPSSTSTMSVAPVAVKRLFS